MAALLRACGLQCPDRGKSGAFVFNVPLYMSARRMDFKTLDCTVLVSLDST